MTKEKSIEVMDALNELGYSVTILAAVIRGGHINFAAPNEKVSYHLSVSEMSIDKVDVRALVEVADRFELDIGFSSMRGGAFSFEELDRTPEVVRNPRRHPKK